MSNPLLDPIALCSRACAYDAARQTEREDVVVRVRIPSTRLLAGSRTLFLGRVAWCTPSLLGTALFCFLLFLFVFCPISDTILYHPRALLRTLSLSVAHRLSRGSALRKAV